MKNEKGTLLKICFMLDSMGIVIEPTGEPGGSLVPFLFKNRAKNINKCGGFSEKKTARGVRAEIRQCHHFDLVRIERNDSFRSVKPQNPTHLFLSKN